MKQCGNITGRPKPTPYLNPSKSLTKLNKKRKRARSQRTYRTKRATPRRRSRRSYTTRRRKRGRPRLSARRGSRQRPSESSSIVEEASSSSCKRPCRSIPKEKKSDDDDQASMSRSHSGSDRDQESRPVTSKHKSLDASQMNRSIEKWDIAMAQAPHEPPLEAPDGCGSRSPIARSRCSSGGAREMSQELPQSSPPQELL